MERSYKDDLNDTCLSCIACCSAETSGFKFLPNLIKRQGYSQGFLSKWLQKIYFVVVILVKTYDKTE